MSIAVRVSVWVLGVLVVISAAVAVLALTQKQTLQDQNQTLRTEINEDEAKLADITTKAKKLQDEAEHLNSKISQAQEEKNKIQGQYDELKQKSDAVQTQLEQANTDRDDWKNRVTTMRHANEELLQKLQHPPVKIVYRDRIKKVIVHDKPAAPVNPYATSSALEQTPPPTGQGDQYWASVIKEKAALQVDIQKQKFALDQAQMQVADLKKQNMDLALEIKQVNNEKAEIIQKIKYGQDLADNLSVDLARARNDQKAVNERADKMKEENLQLQAQLKDLNASKLQLEQTVARLTGAKDQMQQRLIQTESVIQNRIDDIWRIKESLDKKLAENSSAASSGSSMELPPIIVNASTNNQKAQQQAATAVIAGQAGQVTKAQGSVISINQSNNFVIVDLGQSNSSVAVGNLLRVYRDSNEIAGLEVIQVRKDICAADIKTKSSDLKVGDIVKL
ncbi:MAG: hypothetical protein HQL13_01685 [Candidatus Omnitrophica bacterium]|nr:hypothetical protein [Candidatus Omnitrophota bacterium]